MNEVAREGMQASKQAGRAGRQTEDGRLNIW